MTKKQISKLIKAIIPCLIYILIPYYCSQFNPIYQEMGVDLKKLTFFIINIPLILWILASVFSLVLFLKKAPSYISTIWLFNSFLMVFITIIALFLPLIMLQEMH